jgi:hypothetical protein
MMQSFQITGITIMAGLDFGVRSNFWATVMSELTDTGDDENSLVFPGYVKNENIHTSNFKVEVENFPIKKVRLMTPQPSTIKH